MTSRKSLMLSLLRTVNQRPISMSSTFTESAYDLSATLNYLVDELFVRRDVEQKTEDYYIITVSITEEGIDFMKKLEIMNEL